MLALAALAVLVLWTTLARRRTRMTKPPLLLNGSQASTSPSIQRSDGKVGSANSECSVSMVTVSN